MIAHDSISPSNVKTHLLSSWEFSFPVQLHLKMYIEHWRAVAASSDGNIAEETQSRIEQELREFPFLLEPIEDLDLLQPHQEFIDLLFAPIIPHSGFSKLLTGVTKLFLPTQAIIATKAYRDCVHSTTDEFMLTGLSFSGNPIDLRVLYAYKFILKKFYNYDFNVEHPIITALVDHQTGLTRYFKLWGQGQYFDILLLAPLPEIDPHKLQAMLEQNFDTTIWAKILPPSNFVFSGIIQTSLIDVTTEHAVTRLEHHLLNISHLDEWRGFSLIREEIRNLFRLKDLKLGIATLQNDGEFNFLSRNPLWNSLLISELAIDHATWYPASIYEEIKSSGQTIIIEDLQKQKKHPSFDALMQAGYNNLILTPVHYKDRMIGILELSTPVAGGINGLALFKINQLKPIFAIAMTRLVEEFETKVEKIILQQFTSIHPAVQWRFREVAIRMLHETTDGIVSPSVVFENIYPFYGSLDIRDSSKKRNQAIARDLLFNLHCSKTILKAGLAQLSYDVLGALIHEIESKEKIVHTDYTSADEASITDFIRHEVNPVIFHLHNEHPILHPQTKKYIASVTSIENLCSPYRHGFESATSRLMRIVNHYLDQEEEALQRHYPCYFEKLRTDGIEYNIYTGPAIAKGQPVGPLFLDHLRLRQLTWSCKIAQDIGAMQTELIRLMNPMDEEHVEHGLNDASDPIEIAPLILAYGDPITLHFRMDEKRFDIDGALDVRYEVLKKRIDKATLHGSNERLTQPGHIAIVYTQDAEANSYLKHINYLINLGLIDGECERMVLEPLQGVVGLRALRLKVKC